MRGTILLFILHKGQKMRQIRLFLWDVCDYATPRHMVTFRAAAWLLGVLGCNYWKESADYLQGVKNGTN
jgi:hypothetical protein